MVEGFDCFTLSWLRLPTNPKKHLKQHTHTEANSSRCSFISQKRGVFGLLLCVCFSSLRLSEHKLFVDHADSIWASLFLCLPLRRLYAAGHWERQVWPATINHFVKMPTFPSFVPYFLISARSSSVPQAVWIWKCIICPPCLLIKLFFPPVGSVIWRGSSLSFPLAGPAGKVIWHY